MKAVVKTKGNYRNLNGALLEVVEIVGTRVTCRVDTGEYGMQNVDFHKKEVVDIYESVK